MYTLKAEKVGDLFRLTEKAGMFTLKTVEFTTYFRLMGEIDSLIAWHKKEWPADKIRLVVDMTL